MSVAPEIITSLCRCKFVTRDILSAISKNMYASIQYVRETKNLFQRVKI